MKPTISRLLLLLIILQYSCKKTADSNLFVEDFEIKIIYNDYVGSYKFNPLGYPLTRSDYSLYNMCEFNGNLPIRRESGNYTDSAFYRLVTYQYNEIDRSLSYHLKEYMFNANGIAQTYILKDDLSILYSFNNYNDTTFYNYNNTGRLETIVRSGWIDSLLYDSNNNLIEVKNTTYNNEYITKYNYNIKNQLIKMAFEEDTIVYTYTEDDKLSTVNECSIIQKNKFVPINMNPVNFYRKSYLDLLVIH